MRVRVYTEPSLEQARLIVSDLLSRKALVILAGACTVYYEGRSASKLGEGERLVIVKPDGAVLVHRPTGYSPVNWQPDSKLVTAELAEGELVLRSVRERPREVLEVRFTRVALIVGLEGVEDHAEFSMYLDERELRDYLARHPEVIEPGLRVIKVERPVEPGFVDLYAVDRNGNTVIIEVKRVTAGKDAVLQLKRYVEAFKKHNPGARVRGILVAPALTRQAMSLASSLGLEYRIINVERIYEELKRERESRTARSILSFLSSGRS